MGTVHARNAARLERARLVAVASTRPERAAEAAAELGVRASTYGELLAAEDVDAVVVAARSIDHAVWAPSTPRATTAWSIDRAATMTASTSSAASSSS